MYFDRQKRTGEWILLVALALVIVLAAEQILYEKPARQVREEAAYAISQTIRDRHSSALPWRGSTPRAWII